MLAKSTFCLIITPLISRQDQSEVNGVPRTQEFVSQEKCVSKKSLRNKKKRPSRSFSRLFSFFSGNSFLVKEHFAFGDATFWYYKHENKDGNETERDTG